jgi:SAM-dependent methyltransferase
VDNCGVGLTLDIAGALEITDLLWQCDGHGKPIPVLRAAAVSQLAARGQRRAARIVGRMPATAGVLDAQDVAELMLRVHYELQRLSEELQLARRIADLLAPLVARIRETGGGAVRVVDVGCGVGYVVRWLAATSALGEGIELAGVDMNATLVDAATRLADRESLNCRFVRGNAFAPGVAVDDGPRTVVISSGLMHHVPSAELAGFFGAQAALEVAAFAHWDIVPCAWSTLGAWVFHQARMREPVSRHDGVMSARRAHPAEVLLTAAQAGAPDYAARVLEGGRWHPRAIDVLRPVVGVSAALQIDDRRRAGAGVPG